MVRLTDVMFTILSSGKSYTIETKARQAQAKELSAI